MFGVGSEVEDGVIIRGSMDIASMPTAAAAGWGRECRDCELGPEERDASMMVFKLLRRRIMKYVARRRMISRRTAPPIIPPN